MRSWRQNVIISHGGQHGVNARTFRKGTPVTPDAAALIPNSVLGATQAADAPAAETEKPKPLTRGSEPGDHPVLKKLSDAVREDQGAPPEDPAKALREAVAKDEVSRATASPKAEASPEIPDPRTKRDLRGLRKAEVEVVAKRHGIEVEEGTKGRTDMLRDLLTAKLNL